MHPLIVIIVIANINVYVPIALDFDYFFYENRIQSRMLSTDDRNTI